MSTIRLSGTIAVRINCHDDIPAIHYLKDEFRYHWYEDNVGEVVHIGEVVFDSNLSLPTNAVLLRDKRLYAVDDVLYCTDGDSCVSIHLNEETFQLKINGKTRGTLLVLVLQSILNWYMPRHGLVFLHTASFMYHGRVYAIHGFGGAGKTETMVEALQRGAQYISDDLAIVDQEARIHPYYRKIAFHDYSFTPEQLERFQIDKKRYHLMKFFEGRSGRLPRYMYQRLRGRFNISVLPSEFSSVDNLLSVDDCFAINYNYWLDSSNKTGFNEISNEYFQRRMTFCMQNEFRFYVDFDGFFKILYDFWEKKQAEHDGLLSSILSQIDIKGISISSHNYKELAALLLA